MEDERKRGNVGQSGSERGVEDSKEKVNNTGEKFGRQKEETDRE